MQSTDRDRILVTDLAPNCARLGKANVVRLARCAATDNAGLSGDELAVFLTRRRIVFAATRRRRASGFCGRMIGAAIDASISSTKICSLAVAEPWAATEPAGSSTEACIDWIDASPSLKALPTRSASAAIRVFLAGMFLWTQPAASSSDWSCATIASNCSRSFADCSGPSVARAGRSVVPGAGSRSRMLSRLSQLT
jgi:hypothetical protein